MSEWSKHLPPANFNLHTLVNNRYQPLSFNATSNPNNSSSVINFGNKWKFCHLLWICSSSRPATTRPRRWTRCGWEADWGTGRNEQRDGDYTTCIRGMTEMDGGDRTVQVRVRQEAVQRQQPGRTIESSTQSTECWNPRLETDLELSRLNYKLYRGTMAKFQKIQSLVRNWVE